MQELNLRLLLPDIRMLRGNAVIELEDNQIGIDTLYEAYHEAKTIRSKRSALFVAAALIEAEKGRDNPSRMEELRQEGRELTDYIAGNMDDSQLHSAFVSSKPVRIIMGQV